MVHKKRFSAFGIVLGVLLMSAAAWLGSQTPVQAAVTTFTVNLTGAQETPPIPGGAGQAIATFSFDDATRVLSYDMNVMGLAADQITASHIHRGAAGVAGPIIYPLSTAGVTHIQGTVTLTPADVADLMAGNLYVNVHSVQYPAGFARAQLNLSAGGQPASQAIVDGISKTIAGAIAAWNAKDSVTFASYWTDAGLKSSFDADSRAEALAFLPEFIGSPPISLRSVSNITSTGPNNASIHLELIQGQAVTAENDRLVLVNGVWKFDNEDDQSPAIPAGVKTVDLKLQEFAFVFDKAQVADGNFAFKINNVGKQDHEVVLVKVSPGINLQAALAASGPDDSGPPPGIDDVAQDGPFDPGTGGSIVFNQQLSSGHYALLCFVPDTDGTPHAFKGMVAEFDVANGVSGGGSGSTVRPPNTGDGGLLSNTGGHEVSAGLLAAGILTGIAGLGGLVAVSKRAA